MDELPVELYSKIFCFCLPFDGRVYPSPTATPLLLAQVCRQWRAIALTTPQLWSSIFFQFPSDPYAGLNYLYGDEISMDPTTTLVDLWFSRSAGYPLSITLRCDYGGGLPRGLLAVLKSKSAQWERLEVVLSPTDMQELNTVSGPFPRLRIIAIEVYDELPHDFGFNSHLYICASAPSLSALRMPLSFEMHPIVEDAASPCLTTLELTFPNSAQALTVFAPFPHLRNIILHIGDGFHAFHTPPSALTMVVATHLRCLVLAPTFFGDIPQLELERLLSHVILPALEHLVAPIQDPASATAVASLVARSRCALLCLTLNRASLSQPTWAALRTVLDTLPTLALTNTGFTDGWESPGLFPDVPETRLPRLQALLLTVRVGMSHQADYLYRFFLQILNTRSTLRRARLQILILGQLRSTPASQVSVPMPVFVPTDVLPGFERLAAQGMHITLGTPTQVYSGPRCSVDDIDEDYDVVFTDDLLPFCDW